LGSILSALNGHIFAVLGNHDGHKVRKELRHWCVETATEMHLKLPKHPAIIMHHCPWRTWPGQNRGAINLHGHCHSPMPRSYHQRQIDVGVDAWEMRPVSLKTVLALAQQPLGIPAGIPALGYDHYRPSE
jgi:calcineurin-like phosphoesterase family protein